MSARSEARTWAAWVWDSCLITPSHSGASTRATTLSITRAANAPISMPDMSVWSLSQINTPKTARARPAAKRAIAAIERGVCITSSAWLQARAAPQPIISSGR